MALTLANRVRETTTTTGTGTVTLAGAVTGYQAFSVIGNANTTYYTISGQGTSEFEVGIGTYTLSGTTLSRDTVLASSNGGSLVNFSAGTKDAFVTYPSNKAVYLDASSNVTIPGTIVGPATATVFNTVSTTVNAFGAASTALNMGHASGTNTILGATTLAALSATTGAFSGLITKNNTAATQTNFLSVSGSTTAATYADITNTTGALRIGIESSVGGILATGTAAYASVISSNSATALQLAGGGVIGVSIANGGAVSMPAGGGLAVTGTLSASGYATFTGPDAGGTEAVFRNTDGGGIRLSDNNADAAARDFRIGNRVSAFGDMGIAVSTTKGGNTFTNIMTLAAGSVAVTGTLSATGNISMANNTVLRALNTDNVNYHALIGLTQGAPTNQIGIGDGTRTIYMNGNTVVTGTLSTSAATGAFTGLQVGTGSGANTGLIIGNYTTGVGGIWCTAVTPSTVNYVLAATTTVVSVNAPSGGTVNLNTNNVTTMSINSTGHTVGGASSPVSGVYGTNSFKTATVSQTCLNLTQDAASSPYGMFIAYGSIDPNNTSSEFLYFTGGGNLRMSVRSNGGIANVQANDVNVSDVRLKKNIELAGNYLDKICAIPVKTFLYKDQTDEFLNLGVIAQDVESVAPELIDSGGFGETPEDGVPLKSIYQTDLQFALMKAIQELAAKVAKLEAA